jgi:hypothetical protein
MSTEQELDPELAKLIGHARGDTLESEAVEALVQRFSGTIPATPSPRSTLWKLFGIGSMGLAGIVAGFFWLTPDRPVVLEKSGSTFSASSATHAEESQAKPTTVLDLDESVSPKKAAPAASSGGVQEFELIRAARAALPTDRARSSARSNAREEVPAWRARAGTRGDRDQRAEEARQDR